MPPMRPVLTDFSLGEVSPKLGGRVDLPLSTQAAKEMTNVQPWELGGFGKRGGFQFQAIVDALTDKAVRLIPWSISNALDLLVVLFDKKIKILNVSGGQVPMFLLSVDGITDLEILYLRGAAGDADAIPAYDEAVLTAVRYAQSLNELVLVHQDYPPFYCRAVQSPVAGTISVRYGLYQFTSNVAVTQEVVETVDVYRDMSYEQIISALSPLITTPTGTRTFTATEGLSGKILVGSTLRDITQVVITKTGNTRSMRLAGTTYTDASGSRSYSGARYLGSVLLSSWPGLHILRDVSGKVFDDGSTTYTTALNRLEAMGLKNGREYVLSDNMGALSLSLDAEQSISFRKAWTNYTIAISYSGGGSAITFSSGQSGSLNGSLVIADEKISINGYSSPMNDMVDRLATWMVRDKVYPCDPSFSLNGAIPLTAIKTDTLDGPVVTVSLDSGLTLELSRNAVGVTGQIGVILTPFGEAGLYPSCVAFHQGRLVMGGSKREPNVIYFSKVNDYSNFAFFEEIEYIQTAMTPTSEWPDPNTPQYETRTNTNQQIGASSAIMLQIATDENESIQTLAAQDDLFIGTATSEWIFPAGLTAINPRVVLVSRHGSAPMQPKFVENAIIFVNESRRRIRAFGQPGQDLLKLAEHIAKSGIVGFDFRQDPRSELYAMLENGDMIVGRLSETGVAWARVRTSSGDKIESVCAIRSSDEDAVYCIIRRLLNGSPVRTIERLVTTDDDTFAGRMYLDCATYIGTPGSGMTIARFASMTVRARFRGLTGVETEGSLTFNSSGVATSFTPDGGTSGAVPSFDEAFVGLPYLARVETFRMDTHETEGVPKKADAVHLRMYESGPFNFVKDAVGLYRPKETYPVALPTLDDATVYPYTGPIRYENAAPWDVDQTIIMESSTCTPMSVLALVPQYEVGESI